MCISSPGRPTHHSPIIPSLCLSALPGRKKEMAVSAAKAHGSHSFSNVCTLPHLYTRLRGHARAPLDAAACAGHVRWTGANLSHLTWTTCLNLHKRMFCVDLRWQLMSFKEKAWNPEIKHPSNPLILSFSTTFSWHIRYKLLLSLP